MTDPAFPAGAGVRALAARYRAGTLSPVAVVEAGLARIAALDGQLNAIADSMAAEARAEAAAREAELRAGRDLGPLHGIPVAIKDLIAVAGVATGFGSRVMPPAAPGRDARLVSNLRAAGAVIFPKTNLLEYAYGIAHPAIGQTNNPHDPRRTAGGSSGGSAAAVASGMVPLAVGTDTGGSIRIPAAYCGVTGMKPSFGLVPLDGVFPLAPSLDHAGPLAHSVEDAALLLAAMSGRTIEVRPMPVAGLRIGVLRRHFPALAANRPVGAHVDGFLSRLAAAGAVLSEVDLPELAEANGHLLTILRPEASRIHADLLARNPEGYAKATRAQIEAGFAVTATDYLAAQDFARVLRQRVEALLKKVDVLASPAVPFVAPFEDPEIAEGEDSEMLASGFANLTGHPALSLPCGRVEGLPVGLQLTGGIGRDGALLAAARAIEYEVAGVDAGNDTVPAREV